MPELKDVVEMIHGMSTLEMGFVTFFVTFVVLKVCWEGYKYVVEELPFSSTLVLIGVLVSILLLLNIVVPLAAVYFSN